MSLSPSRLALGPLEAAINRALGYDPGSRAALAELAGKTLTVECNLPPVTVVVAFGGDGHISLSTSPADGPGVTLKGGPVALAVLLSRAGNTYSFARSGVTIEGDQEILIGIGAILKTLEIDWEQALAEVTGDVPAHLAGDAVRSANRWLAETAERSGSGLGEYIREESGLTVGNTEARGWYEDVRHLAADSERLSARVERLRSRLKPDDDGKAAE